MKELQISVIICTYNRAAILENAIISLINQTIANNLYEVIVVDNNSKDNTKELVEKLKVGHPNVNYIFEEKPGLSNARNAGYLHAKGSFVGYMDDDAKASSNYIEEILKIIEDVNPDIFGGPIFPYYECEKPDWFKDVYGTYSSYDKTGWVTTLEQYLSGSNITFRKSLLFECGGFDPRLGMKGNLRRYGEETQIVYWAHQQNKKIYYSTGLIVYHLVPVYKLNPLFFLTSAYESGRDHFLVNDSSIDPLNEIVLKDITFHLIHQFEELYNIAKEQYDKEILKSNQLEIQNFVVEKVSPLLVNMGYQIRRFNSLNNRKRSVVGKLLDFNLRRLFLKFKKL